MTPLAHVGLHSFGSTPLAWSLSQRPGETLAYRIFDPVSAFLAGTRLISHRRLLRGPMNFISFEAGADGKANEDWVEAEREIRKGQAGKKDVA